VSDYRSENVWLMKGDCLERMKEIESGSVDMILTDPPYGTTACKWDSIIPLEPMWELETIRDLSCVYSSWSNQAKSPDCRSPLAPALQQSAEDIENKLLKQFGIMK